MGDSVDNVPGVPGIGPKNAAQLVTEYGDLERILAAAPSMKPSKRRDALITHAEAARMSRELVILRDDAPLPMPVAELGVRDPDRPKLAGWLLRQGFRSTLQRLGLEEGGVEPAASPSPPGDALPPETAPTPFGSYETITTMQALSGWIEIARCDGKIALKAAVDRDDPMRAALIGIALAVAPGRAGYIPLSHAGDLADGPPAQLPAADMFAALAPLLADRSVLKIFHDAKFDLMVLKRAGLDGPVAAIDDSMLISFAQDAGAHGHGLDELPQLHFGHAALTLDGTTGTGRARLPFAQVKLDAATAYAAEQADLIYRLWQALRPRLRATSSLACYEQVDRRLTPVLMDMESIGIKVDETELRRMSVDFGERMALMETDIHHLAGKPFNLGSPKQLGEMLFDELKLPGGRRMKTGAWGTDANVLQGLAEQGHELPGRVLEWRQIAKLKSTYADALVEQINPATGRVHTRFAMAVAATGRLSSVDPNLQNIPIRTEEGSRIRRAFIAEPGHVLVSADYSQIELRLLAHVAEIPVLRQSFADGEDIHARTASEVFGVPMAQMDGATRRRAKAINFGIIYGISAFGLARQLSIAPGEAKLYIDAYFERYPGIRAYMEATREEARLAGYVLTPFGRRCWIPGIGDKNPARRGYAERQASNAPLQGGAADIIKRAMVRLPAALREAGLSARLLLQVHDELLFEAPESEAQATAEIARSVMQMAVALRVPLVVETGSGHSWSEAH